MATNEDSHLTLRELDEIRRDGVGVLRVGELETTVVVHEQPLNPAHTVTIHPDVRLGPYTEAVRAAVEKFNRQSQKNGLQDMCEIVERVTLSLLLKAVKKGYVNVTVTQATKMDWENRINALASPNRYQAGKTVLLDNDMKTDHLAFKNTRNLVDHARGRRENNQLTQQLVERMLMGQRLLGQLVTISRRIR
ncbi:MAG: hypothetical protein HYX90_08155 [Chloroflexi bacterium]|nr:hypothetical protein [Chloroflexota bacterium]